MKIKIQDLVVEFKNGTRAIDGINLEIEEGIFGLLGENGAGKTTLMRVLTTLLPITNGEVKLGELQLIPENYLKIQNCIGYLPQELTLYPQLQVREALEYMGSLSGLSKTLCRERIDYYLECTNLKEHQKKRISQLSGGMKRRVGLIQAMVGNPKILIVDEPTTGLDPEERIRIRNLLVDFAKDRIVLFSTHVIEDISSTCRHLAIMKKGRILYQGELTNLLKQTQGHVKVINIQREEELAEMEREYIVCTKQYTENGIELKVIVRNGTGQEGVDSRITLEDAYMYVMNQKN